MDVTIDPNNPDKLLPENLVSTRMGKGDYAGMGDPAMAEGSAANFFRHPNPYEERKLQAPAPAPRIQFGDGHSVDSSIQAGNTAVHGQSGVPIPSYKEMTDPHAKRNMWANALQAFLAPVETGVLSGIANRGFPGGFGRGMALGALEGQQNYQKQQNEEMKLNNYMDKSMNSSIIKQGAYAQMKSMFANHDASIGNLDPTEVFNREFARMAQPKPAGGFLGQVAAMYGMPKAIQTYEHGADTSAGTQQRGQDVSSGVSSQKEEEDIHKEEDKRIDDDKNKTAHEKYEAHQVEDARYQKSAGQKKSKTPGAGGTGDVPQTPRSEPGVSASDIPLLIKRKIGGMFNGGPNQPAAGRSGPRR